MPHKISQHAVEDAAPDDAGVVHGDMGVFFRQLMALLEASQQGYALFDGSDELRFANSAFAPRSVSDSAIFRAGWN